MSDIYVAFRVLLTIKISLWSFIATLCNPQGKYYHSVLRNMTLWGLYSEGFATSFVQMHWDSVFSLLVISDNVEVQEN